MPEVWIILLYITTMYYGQNSVRPYNIISLCNHLLLGLVYVISKHISTESNIPFIIMQLCNIIIYCHAIWLP